MTLIEKLKAADGPSRELDAEVFEALGYEVRRSDLGNDHMIFLANWPGEGARPTKQALTSDVGALRLLTRKMGQEIKYISYHPDLETWHVTLLSEASATHKREEYATIIALLSALEGEQG